MRTQRRSLGVLMMFVSTVGSIVAGAALFNQHAAAQEQRSRPASSWPSEKITGSLELVVAFTGAMPTGVTVAQDGRIFVNFPRWGDPVPFTVAEIKDDQPVAYPNADINQLDPARARETFVSVQSGVVDPRVPWTDTLAVAGDGYLYAVANRLHRQADYHDGNGLREKPYSLFRVKIDGTPVQLR
jgi:hypothetical protein